MLTQFAACDALFHTATGTAFADLMVEGHRETWPIRSKRFRGWLRRRYYEVAGGALSGQAISSELDLLEARAQFDAPERPVHARIAEHDGRIYLDLADEHWRAVEIGSDGWQVNKFPPVRFRRPAGMLPLPAPERGGSIEDLLPFLNLSNRNDFVLVVAWLLAALRPRGPYPLLAISGEQGSTKTVLSKMLKALVDPNTAPVRALPREERELMIAANNGYLLAFDNLSGLPAWLSDGLCRLATGGSFAVRQLYTDDEEVLFQASRPLLVNGIEDVTSRADLADRGIFLTLAPIGEQQRRSEAELWREFDLARPRILGALLDAAVRGLQTMPNIRLTSLPRLADFALWATACEPALWPAGTFARAYDTNRRAAVEGIIEADPVAVCVRALMAERGGWAGTASDLLRAATGLAGTKVSNWPQNPAALAGRLRRAQTFLRMLGIEISFTREGRAGTRTIRIIAGVENRATMSVLSAASAPSAPAATTSRSTLEAHHNRGLRQARERC
jgi:hypothetical protein